jgi:hypothetical protein
VKVFGVKVVHWVILAPAILALGYLGVGFFVADRLSAPSHQRQELTPAGVGLDYSEVSIQSTDGLELAGWWVPGDEPSRAVVLVPGIWGRIIRSTPSFCRARLHYLLRSLT